MRAVLLILIFLFYTNCSKPKTVLICGDHACINNAEAEQYFEENLSLEVKIIDKNREGKIDLVKLNLTDNSDDNREVVIESKTETESLVKILTNDEIMKFFKVGNMGGIRYTKYNNVIKLHDTWPRLLQDQSITYYVPDFQIHFVILCCRGE